MQLLPMASSPDGLISARHAVITKTPGWGVLTTTSDGNSNGAGGGDMYPDREGAPPPPNCNKKKQSFTIDARTAGDGPPYERPPNPRWRTASASLPTDTPPVHHFLNGKRGAIPRFTLWCGAVPCGAGARGGGGLPGPSHKPPGHTPVGGGGGHRTARTPAHG